MRPWIGESGASGVRGVSEVSGVREPVVLVLEFDAAPQDGDERNAEDDGGDP
jgi:hypothetical protein